MNLRERLQVIDGETGILRQGFKCDCYERCRISQSTVSRGYGLQGEKTVKAPYVGASSEAVEIRRAYVGIDAGGNKQGPEAWDYEEAYQGWHEHYRAGQRRFNQHYLWIMKVEALVSGERSKCYSEGCCQRQSPCCLDQFVQCNLVRCSHGEGNRSNTTSEMVKNCRPNVLRVINELRPHLILFHGRAADVRREYDVSLEPWVGSFDPAVKRYVGPDFEAVVAIVNHPSWERRQRRIGDVNPRQYELQWPIIVDAVRCARRLVERDG